MSKAGKLGFFGGQNIALKVPEHCFDRMLAFYRDVLRLEPLPRKDGQVSFRFGPDGSKTTLWLDKVQGSAQSDAWLELNTTDIESARRYFQDRNVDMPEIEKLPDGYEGFWVADPMGRIYLVTLPGK